MSESTAKAVRRDLRRAMGQEALAVITGQAEVIAQQVIPQVNALKSRDQQVSIELLRLSAKITAISQGLKDKAERHSTLKGRLRWLLTGR